MQYIRPKITYPFSCVSLTEKQCQHIQAPVLAEILPKLHLNHHTPRAVLFAGPRYGGLSISENYKDLGYSHLQYMIGHIKMHDEVGQLILSLITHTQLQVGSVTPFFRLAYPKYAKWIDSTWITDVWKFAHQAKIEIDVEKHWVPKLLRGEDTALMDMALTYNLNAYQLQCINQCRLYLQVITISDITSARGDHFLRSALTGTKEHKRQSHFSWLDIPPPPSHCWHTWRLFLQFFSQGRRLLQPMGPWIHPPHYQWRWYVDHQNDVWERRKSTWIVYKAHVTSGRCTRTTSRRYSTGSLSTLSPNESSLFPITVTHLQNGTFTIVASTSPFRIQADAIVPDLWRHTTTLEVLQHTPPFFQHLLSNPMTKEKCQEICEELQAETLVACSDGACDRNQGRFSCGVVFASELLTQEIGTAAGPVDGHPSLVSSYRAELSRIVATLYLIYRICQFYHIHNGKMTLYCNNKGALRNAFRPITLGFTPYLLADHDLIEVAQSLINLIPDNYRMGQRPLCRSR
jgi:hypothetical protein